MFTLGALKAGYWMKHEDGKRKRNAEFLLYPSIAPSYFERIVINDQCAYEFCSRQSAWRDLRLPVSVDQAFSSSNSALQRRRLEWW
jgi:hypothetical protein